MPTTVSQVLSQTLSQALQPRSRHTRWFVLSAVLLLCGSALLGVQAYRQHLLAEQAQHRIAQLRSVQAASVVPKASRNEQDEQKRWAALKLERDFPWEKVFQAVEKVSSTNIELLEFQPDKSNRRIVLRGEARDLKALTAYLEALAAQAALTNVHLTHQQDLVRDRLETVSFEIKATLVGQGQ